MPATTVISPVIPLTRLDRCDRCGAAAKNRVVLAGGGELLFCEHHTRAHAAKLAELKAEVQRGS